MALSSTYYLNGPSLGSATAVFTDAGLTTCAPDGFYSDGVIVRELVECVLLPQQTCPSCGPTEINVTSVGGYMEPCSGGSIDDYMGAVVVLDAVVDVDTEFVVEVYYVETGGTCGGTQFSQTLNVVVPNGTDISNFNACTQGVNFPTGAVICSACIVSCDNPSVIIGAFECLS